jgi:hypothetical protein
MGAYGIVASHLEQTRDYDDYYDEQTLHEGWRTFGKDTAFLLDDRMRFDLEMIYSMSRMSIAPECFAKLLKCVAEQFEVEEYEILARSRECHEQENSGSESVSQYSEEVSDKEDDHTDSYPIDDTREIKDPILHRELHRDYTSRLPIAVQRGKSSEPDQHQQVKTIDKEHSYNDPTEPYINPPKINVFLEHSSESLENTNDEMVEENAELAQGAQMLEHQRVDYLVIKD